MTNTNFLSRSKGANPPPLTASTIELVYSDSKFDCIFTFGGLETNIQKPTNDIFLYNINKKNLAVEITLYSSTQNPSIPNLKIQSGDVPPCLFGHTLTSIGHKKYLVIGGASMENRDKIAYLASNLFEKQTVQEHLYTLVIETDEEEGVTVFHWKKHYIGDVA